MVENPLFPLNSVSASWLNPSFSTYAMDMILAFVCGLGLFLLLLPWLQGSTSFPPTRKKKKKPKHLQVKKRQCRNSKWSHNLKASRNHRKNVEEIQNLTLLLQSLLGKFSDKDSFLQLLHEDAPGEVFKQGPAGAQGPPHQHLEALSPTTLSQLASLTCLTKRTHPLPSSSEEEHEGEADLTRIPLDIAPQRSLPGHSYWASLITAISGLGCINYSILFLSWWWETAKLLFFSTWVHGKSKQDHLSHHPSDPTLWVDPTGWQAESGGLSFINSDVQTLLEMLITKRVELKSWKENDKSGSSIKEITPAYSVFSLGNILKSLGGKRDINAQTIWNPKGKPEQPHGSQHFSYHKDLKGPLEQNYSQLFWGLPTLHSESLVATAWVPKRSSIGQHKVVAFNKVSKSLSIRYQNNEASQLSQEETQSQLLEQILSPSVAQGQTMASTSYCHPNLPTSSSSQMKTAVTTCTQSKKEAQSFIPTEGQYLECSLQNKMKWKKVLSSEIKKTQEVHNQPTPNLPQGSLASQTSTTHELQKRPQQRVQGGRFISDKQHLGPPCRFRASQERMQPQGKFPGKGQCQIKDKCGPSQATQSPLDGRSSKDMQKMESKHSETLHTMGLGAFKHDFPSKGLEPQQHRQPVDLSWSSGSTPVKIQNDNMEDSEGHLSRTKIGVSESALSTGPDKEILEKFLQDHFSRKLVQINEGMIPVCVRGSWLAANYVFPKTNMHTEPIPIQLASSKNQQSYVNTSQELFFLDPGTHLILETDVMRSRVRRRWRPYLQALDPNNCKEGEAQTSPLPQPAFSSSVFHDYRAISIATVASLLEELPQKSLGKRVIRKISFPTLQSPLPAPSPSEVQTTWRGAPLGGTLRTSEAHRPSPPHTYGLVSMKQQSRVIMGIGKASLEPRPSLDMVRYETQKESKDVASGDSCHGVTMLEIKVGTQSSIAEKTNEKEVEREKPPGWEMTVGTSVMANSQTINVNLRSLGTLGNRKSPSPSRISISQDPGDPNLKAKVGSGVHLKVEFESEKQPQDQGTGVPQDCPTDEPSTTDILPPQASVSNSESMFRKDMQFPQDSCGKFNIHKKGIGKEDSLVNDKLQTQRSVHSQPHKENRAVEPQALMTVVGQILMDKLGLQHRSGPTELNGHKDEHQTLVGTQSCHLSPSYSQQRQMFTGIASGQQASSKDQSIHFQSKWIRGKDSNWTWKPRNPEPPATPMQHRPTGVSTSSHLRHYPTCFFQHGVLHGQPGPVSHDFPGVKTFRNK